MTRQTRIAEPPMQCLGIRYGEQRLPIWGDAITGTERKATETGRSIAETGSQRYTFRVYN